MASDGDGRQRRRLVVVVGCLLALAVAAGLLPSMATSFHGPPGVSLVQDSDVAVPGGEGAERYGTSQLGALEPGDSTTVGGLEDAPSQSLRALGPSVHFTVQSDSPAYWRTGAYGEYTGSGWEQTGGEQPYDGPLDTGGAGERVSYRVELNRLATAVPTVWQPQSVSAEQSLVVTDHRAIRSADRLPAGTVVKGVSVRPPSHPTVLATAGREYPDEIYDKYTQLPPGTPRQLALFTDELTADADNPYETATAIENWLEANKSYSLDVAPPNEGNVATSFVFEMEAGYCEYFATSMVAMLRTQGIPARYVLGYSTGQPTGENTYTVRGMNAHAWVEVYFPDVGWVRFDPTPGGPRLAVEQAALDRQRESAPSYNHTEVGSPNETEVPDPESVDVEAAMPPANGAGGNATGENAAEDSASRTGTGNVPVATPPGNVSGVIDGSPGESPGADDPDIGEVLTSTPEDGPVDDLTPGRGPTPSRADNVSGFDFELSEQPIPGTELIVTVTYDGQPVRDSTVLFDGEVIGTTGYGGMVKGTVPYTDRLNVTVIGGIPRRDAETPPSIPPPDTRQYALEATPALLANNGTNGTRTYDVWTNATVSVSGTVATGESILVTATIDGVPVRNASVRVDGEHVGTTDERGRASVELPGDPGNVTLSVSRGPVGGEQELRLRALSVDVEPALSVALPWTEVTVTATLGNETAAGVPVTVGGETVGKTGIDGSLSTQLPLSGSARITATQYSQTATTTVEGLWLNLGGVLAALAVAVAGVVAAVRRFDPREVGSLVVKAVGVLLATVDAGIAASRRARRGMADLLAGRTSLADVWAAIAARLSSLGTRFARGEESTAATDSTAAERAIRTAWGVFLSEVSVRDPTTKTPGELATHAIERDGLPPEAVRTLRDAFRAVEYGADKPRQRLPAVETAVERITGATDR